MNILNMRGSFLFFLFSFFCMITGNIHHYLLFLSLILIHECGHAFCAKILGWNLKEIVLYPFGGVTVIEDKINKPMKEELLILLAGPIAQISYYLLFYKHFPVSFSFFHHYLLLFNLLPIYPLDGGKILNLCYQSIFPFLFSHKILIFSSFFFLLSATIFLHSFLFLLSFLFLGIQIVEEKRKEPFLYEKFLLERTFYSFSFPFVKKINGIHLNKMYRDHLHFFYNGKIWINEKEILKKKYFLKK